MSSQRFLRPPKPLYRLIALMAIPLILVCCFGIWWRRVDPVQRMYLPHYASLSTTGRVSEWRDRLKRRHKAKRHFEAWLVDGKGRPVLSAADLGASAASVQVVEWRPAAFRTWLQKWVYGGKSFPALVEWPAGSALLLAMLAFGVGFRADQERRARFREAARHIEGAELVSVSEFRRKVKGDGIGIRIDKERPKLVDAIFGPKSAGVVRIEAPVESQHLLAVGDTGSGKTQFMYSVADEAKRKGESCIIFDSKGGQFVERYYRPERGDVILGLDARAHGWNPSNEIDWSSEATARATTKAQASSVYPGDPSHKDWFFKGTSQDIWQYCVLHHRPDAKQLAQIFEHADPLIDHIVKGTQLQETLMKNTSGTRPSIMGTLTTNVVPMLQQIKATSEEDPGWSAREWSKHRKGWIFLTSTLETRESAAPLHRLWMDSLILRLLTMGKQTNLPTVRMLIDELPTLGELSHLKTAMTEGRECGLTMVLGFQARSQLKAIYGENWEALFSAPYTKLILRTGEPESFEWGSKLVGSHKVLRLKEHVDSAGKSGYTPSDPIEERLVIGSILKGLNPRCGYLCYGNYAVRVKVSVAPQRSRGVVGYMPQVGEPPAILPMPNLADLRAKEEIERQANAAKAAVAVFPIPDRKGKGKGSAEPAEA
jgi:type IV secretory pathway TraG/TraD family ATPase VirD4